ncbi:unnamed protein product [Penicillium camemberti]|uniref:Str. FM013 n=1 Tax=Penicillium camemberti (strain FM 013) TaxID=1429867 RepID=A0A0G4P722_PENC3|nr:unnamed protein product [Penicillium camemberti]
MYLRYLKFHEIGSGASAERRTLKQWMYLAESQINLGSSATTVAPGFVHLTGAFYPASCRYNIYGVLTGISTKKPRVDKRILRCSQWETAGKKPVNDLPSIRSPDPCTLEQREKRTHHMQLPAHRGLSLPTFLSREPFRPAVNLVY